MKIECGCLKGLGYLILAALLLFLLHQSWYWLGGQIIAQAPDTKLPEALEASGALFSGLAFLAAVGTLWVQRKDLELQREELQATREELKGQKEQMEIQNKTSRREIFESSLFRLLELHRQHKYTMENAGELYSISSKDVFDNIVSSRRWREECAGRAYGEISSKYIEIYNDVADDVENGSIYNILHMWHIVFEFVQNEIGLSRGEVIFYLSIFAAQMSSYECALLALHTLGKNGRAYVKWMIEEYGYFSVFQLDMLEDEIVRSYSPSAFALDVWPDSPPTPQP